VVAEHLAHRLLEAIELGIAGAALGLHVGEGEGDAARLATAEEHDVRVALVAHDAAASEVRVAHDAADTETRTWDVAHGPSFYRRFA
jgi:hypothetical protein